MLSETQTHVFGSQFLGSQIHDDHCGLPWLAMSQSPLSGRSLRHISTPRGDWWNLMSRCHLYTTRFWMGLGLKWFWACLQHLAFMDFQPDFQPEFSATEHHRHQVEWGRQKMQEGDYEKATQHFCMALDLRPGFLQAEHGEHWHFLVHFFIHIENYRENRWWNLKHQSTSAFAGKYGRKDLWWKALVELAPLDLRSLALYNHPNAPQKPLLFFFDFRGVSPFFKSQTFLTWTFLSPILDFLRTFGADLMVFCADFGAGFLSAQALVSRGFCYLALGEEAPVGWFRRAVGTKGKHG